MKLLRNWILFCLSRRDDIEEAMVNTFTQIYIQLIFAVQDKISLIQLKWKDELYRYITGIIRNNKHKGLTINAIPNHIHIFIGYKPHQLIPDLLQDIKGSSSKWINTKGFVREKFSWQEGYEAFSYSHSRIQDVARYIENQEQHYKEKNFREEYLELLRRFNISYNEQYILKDVT